MVYLATDLQLHSRSVVVKVLLDEGARQEWVVRKFRQEMEALARISHPGVAVIFDAGELEDGKPFIVMEYVDGVTLRSVMKPEGMPLDRVAQIIRQTGRALAAAHEKQVFHRDLKPENLMLRDPGKEDEQVKIIDFGIAKIKDSVVAPSTATMRTAGTVLYMAPEQLSGRTITAEADIYSLGIIAYEMVTGRRPFNPEAVFELLEMQRAGVLVRPKDLRPRLPEEAQAIILTALAFEPGDRHPRVRDMCDDLAGALIDVDRIRAKEFNRPTPQTPDAPPLFSEAIAIPSGPPLVKTLTATFEPPRATSADGIAEARHKEGSKSWRKSLVVFLVVIVVVVGVTVVFIGMQQYLGVNDGTGNTGVSGAGNTEVGSPGSNSFLPKEAELLKFEKARREVDTDPIAWLTTQLPSELSRQGVAAPLDAQDPAFLYLYGRASLLTGKPEEAAKAFEASISKADLNPSTANATLRKEATFALAATALKLETVRPAALKHFDEVRRSVQPVPAGSPLSSPLESP